MRREDLYVRSPLVFDDFGAFIKMLGGNPKALMRQANLDSTASKSKIHFIPWAAHCRYYELAAETLNESYLGLKWAFEMPKDYRTSGPTLLLGSLASDLRHFLEMVVSYQKIHTNGVNYAFKDDVDAGELIGIVSIHPLSPPCRQLCEHIMAGIAIMGRRYVKDLKLKRVTFQYSEPKNAHWYEKAFQCPVEFNAPQNTLVSDRLYLEKQKKNLTTKLLTPVLKSYLHKQLSDHPRAKKSISDMVYETLPSIMGLKKSDIHIMAELLELHPKKLQRLLKDEGTSYTQILDDVRKSLAERLLVETDISVMRMAKMLDYGTDRAFTLAAKRWFGMTPSQYRKKGQKKPD